jgi:aspartate ammonia-lyase
MSFAMQAGQLELNVMMPLMAQVSLESTEILTNALRILNEKCLKGLTANVEQCQIYAYSTSQIATKLTPILGYSQVAELVKEALKKNISVIQLIKEKKILTDEQIQDLGSNFI